MSDPTRAGGRLSRRSVLTAVGSVSGTAGLAGCSIISGTGLGGDGGGAIEVTAREETPVDAAAEATETPTDSPTPAPTDDPTPAFAVDCLDHDPDDIEIVQEGERWLITDGRSRMMLFDEFENAKKARNIIQHYGFIQRCFVGRPDPPMSYWLADGET